MKQVEDKIKKVYIGTSGWSYTHWVGLFYPDHLKPVEFLSYYLHRFSCVELNSSFYHLPRKTTIEGWVSRTPDSFRFCPKLSRYITHRKRLIEVEGPMQKFFDLFGAMKSRLGPVLIQLPPGMEFNRSLMEDFLHILRNKYHAFRFAIEIRHRSWIDDVFFDLLAQADVAFVIADSGTRYPYHEQVTTDFIYLRLHGPEELYASNYSETQLFDQAGKIRDWLDRGKAVWVFFNNDFHAYAIRNAENLRNILNS